MLLRHTPTTQSQRKALHVNPAKACQPLGAMCAALGIHGCLPHSHGSQGCCAYHRSALARHYKEPAAASSSSFTEGASVFGGQPNLLQALDTIFSVYDPRVVAVHTTCLSETIGDDLGQITDKARKDGKIPEGRVVFGASTPSYSGSHMTGFANMTKAAVANLSESTGRRSGRVNIFPGWVEPADMEEIRHLARELGTDPIVLPDISDVFNTPLTGEYSMFPSGGTPLDDVRATGDATASLALGERCSAPAARWLDAQRSVPCSVLDMPFGLKATDRFVDTLRRIAGNPVPASVERERGQLLDMIADMHQWLYGKRVAVCGDPDQVESLVEFLVSLDMRPVHVLTGTPGKAFTKRIRSLTSEVEEEVNVKAGGDMFLLHQWIKNRPVDLIIGNSYCKHMARDEDIPLVRWGFPILDRVGHQYFPTAGYRGGMRLLEKILDALLDRKDRDDPEESFELVL